MSELPAQIPQVPEHLLALAQDGSLADVNDALKEHRIVNRLAIVQAASSGLKKQFEEGSVVIPNADTLVFDKEGSVDFIPVFFFQEFIKWRDRKDKSDEPAIVEKTSDPQSELAEMCRDADRRMEPYPNDEKLRFRNTHHLNFVVMLTSGPCAGEICALSFHRSMFYDGKKFIGAIQMRKMPTDQGLVSAPMFFTQWKLAVEERSNDEGEWFVFKVAQAEQPWAPKEHLMALKEAHDSMKKEFNERTLGVDHEAGLDKMDEEEGSGEF